ncbi:phenylacetate-coenzyme A ligase [Ruminiclostridium hungatei]|uniref:Phenylacetate-coenzyme A ligase n=1 Tax=Ruminiclostridium hungatei TaxID=48256 RepID=A0A1V4SFC6_RUMHU|nr:phenylacetate--CoA ligase [Ruminiclostridium hungatei]OPX42216.1 phenylacetate-coenzyme A ligase [Ruminiclostridium hungatei]
MSSGQFDIFKELLLKISSNSPFYKEKFLKAKVDVNEITSMEMISQLPFTTKEELREAYPLGLQAVPEEKVVRIHSSSGTTGKPVIIPYTARDVSDWAEMMARSFEMAGITPMDRIQITPGYGLWTAGIGFQAGCERLGAMAVPMGPGNTDKQLQMMMDLKSTVIIGTSSYALVLAEEVEKRGLKSEIRLKKGVIGSERWGEKMRQRIKAELGIEIYDIYGLTEIYGPGIAIDCGCHDGMHYYDDYLYFEIIDSATGKVLPEGETGELVITTLRKEGAPLLRYRTRDLTRIIPGKCACGRSYPRIDRIIGRTDDMVKVKGVNIYPGQIDEILRDVEGVSSEYQIIIDHINGKDVMTLKAEYNSDGDTSREDMEYNIVDLFKKRIGIHIIAEVSGLGSLPRSEKKSKRIIDYRQN